METPKVSNPYVSQGSKEAMLNGDASGIPMTIEGTRKVGTVKGPSLFARKTAAPHKALPFMQAAAIINPTNTTNATIDVADADAIKFKVGDVVTFYDVSTGTLSAETSTIDIIGAAGSGGTGETLITFTGEVWSTPPEADDLLVLADGTQLSANVVVVLEDVTFDGVNDKIATGFYAGVFRKAAVENTTYFVEHENQNIKLIDIV